MFDITEKKAMYWMLETHILPILRTALFMSVSADIEDTAKLTEEQRKRELLQRLDKKHRYESVDVIEHTMISYNLGNDDQEKAYFGGELLLMYDILLKHARTFLEAGEHQKIKDLCA